jgi:hypothetical protein
MFVYLISCYLSHSQYFLGRLVQEMREHSRNLITSILIFFLFQ